MEPRKFQVGDVVKAISFANCFDQFVPEIGPLVVDRIETIEGYAPHHRLVAISATAPYQRVEGAERFFEKWEGGQS